jgi:hypothetical protein
MFVYHIAGKPVNIKFPYSDMSEMEIFDLAMAKTTLASFRGRSLREIDFRPFSQGVSQ